MIVYGTRSTHLKSASLPNVRCTNCESQHKMTVSVYGRHVHIFWIPLFPVGKTAIFECQHCHKGFKKSELGNDAQLAYSNFKGSVKTPIWKFSGLAIIALLIVFAGYSNKKDKERIATLVEQPAMYDVYTFRTKQNYYSTFKILEVFKDSIYVNYNKYETNKLSDVKNIDIKANYDNSMYYVLTTNDMETLSTSGDLKDIKRD
ncbi:zinc-ribbon domain-containing protein [Maribacter sp. 2210JD10-5]|uniref:zinc-ribbon domain-containing protein n=1 Tax=Maribacter sp. 2210JD10-5 TaxID=3386272 RepID=UPI0039BD4386